MNETKNIPTEAEAKRVWIDHQKQLDGDSQGELALALRLHVFYSTLKTAGVRLVNDKVEINDMTPAIWNKMSKGERRAWTMFWNLQMIFSFQCLRCGFPTATGQSGCEACNPIT